MIGCACGQEIVIDVQKKVAMLLGHPFQAEDQL
jgi:hypothetical protein